MQIKPYITENRSVVEGGGEGSTAEGNKATLGKWWKYFGVVSDLIELYGKGWLLLFANYTSPSPTLKKQTEALSTAISLGGIFGFEMGCISYCWPDGESAELVGILLLWFIQQIVWG